MADRLDVAERLAEGRIAVEHTQTYVRACQAVGYQHPDLTARRSRILEWFDSEEGLDLRALDRDCTELRAAAVAVTEALRMQRAQVAELTAAWMGPGGDAAARVLQRHCDAGNAVVTELRAAAQRCESLRDNLWYLVDSKVATAIAVDDRAQAHQPEWLSAAMAVTTGAGDRQSAEEVVRQQVIPYVDNDIRDDWLTVMRSTSDGVETSYGMVIDRMAAAPAVFFEVPGDLGPGYQPLQPAQVSAPTPPPPPSTMPPPAAPAESPAPAADPAPTLAAAAPAAPATDWGTALGDVAGTPAGDLGGGLGGLGGSGGGGGGLIGLASRIVDAMGDLIGSATDDLGNADAFEGDDSLDEDPFHADDASDVTDDEPKESDAVKDVVDTEEAKPDAAPAGAPAPVGVPAPIEPPPPADVPAPVAAPVAAPAAEPAPQGSTPCEIAADQLPQAGQ
jgi:hypothetical protein